MRRLIVPGALIVALAGCGQSAPQKTGDEATRAREQGADAVKQGAAEVARGAQQGSQQVAQGLQQMAQGLQQMAQSTVKPVNFESIKALVPELDGWTRSDLRGEQQSMPISTSRASATYRKDASRIDLEITDSALNQLFLAPFAMFLAAGFSERSDDGFKHAAKVSGYPGYEEWNAKTRRAEVTAAVNNRFIVQATGHDVQSVDDVRKAVESVNLARLAELK